jgi:hypothetical protein
MFAIPAGIGLSYLLLFLYFLSLSVNHSTPAGFEKSGGVEEQKQKEG